MEVTLVYSIKQMHKLLVYSKGKKMSILKYGDSWFEYSDCFAILLKWSLFWSKEQKEELNKIGLFELKSKHN